MEDSFQVFIRRWATPTVLIAVVTAIVGGIIWGNNLTQEALDAATERGVIQARQDNMISQLHDISITNARTAIILNRISEDLDLLEQAVDDHNEEAETWKRRILLNEQRQNGEQR